MSIPGKLLIAVITAVVVSYLSTLLQPALPLVPLLLACAASAIGAVLLSHKPISVPAALADEGTAPASQTGTAGASRGRARRSESRPTASGGGPRETGTVKWFNGTKGFGFIVRDNGEEIFVHYRSIRGEGRRSLKDGQAVRFRVEETDKGPQAEDVEGLD